MDFEGVVKDIAHFGAIHDDSRNFSKSILKHSLDFVTPKLDHLLFSVIEVFLSLEEALENLRDISHVKLVMTESRRRQEGLTHSIENIDGSISQGFYQLLDLLVEAREFVFTDSLVNLLHNLFSGEGEV
jgi:hypothetical protein